MVMPAMRTSKKRKDGGEASRQGPPSAGGGKLTRPRLRDETRVLKLFSIRSRQGWARRWGMAAGLRFRLCRLMRRERREKHRGTYLTDGLRKIAV